MMPSRWPVLSPVEGADLRPVLSEVEGDDTADRQAGFSLVELLITALILTVVLFAIYLMYETNMTTATWGNKKAELQQNARVALDMMEREIRMAGYDPSNASGGAIQCTTLSSTDCSATALTFIMGVDDDNNNATPDTTQKVQYTFNAGPQTITRSLWSWNGAWNSVTTNEVVADGVSSLSLTYCDNAQPTNNCSGLSPAQVKRITIAITASGKAGSKTETFTFASDARLRNL